MSDKKPVQDNVDLAERYASVAAAICVLIPGHIEVVIHDLRLGRIVYIENNISNRAVGDSSLVDIDDLSKSDFERAVIGPYAKISSDGSSVKSVTAVLRNKSREPIGLLCVNMGTEQLREMNDMLSRLLAIDASSAHAPLIRNDWREDANTIIRAVLQERHVKLAAAKREDKKAVLAALDQGGIFNSRGSAAYVAKVMGMSRASLYSLVKATRG